MSSTEPGATYPKPAQLRPAGTVGIIAPGSAPDKPEDLQKGIRHLRSAGLTVKPGFVPYQEQGYLSAPDDVRLREFHQQMTNPQISALICARGGYGCLRLLPDIDYDLAREHRKLLIGYSDITALQLALYKLSNWRSLAGPMVATDWSKPDLPSLEHFWKMAGGTTGEPWKGPNDEPLKPVYEGSSEGVLLGGNFSMICRLIGTPYLPDLTGALLFLEDVGEAPYRIDAMFAELRLSGILEKLGGIILGCFTGANYDKEKSLSYEEVVADYVHDLRIPVASNLIHGHIPSKNTIPIGVRAQLQVGDGTAELTLKESICATQ